MLTTNNVMRAWYLLCMDVTEKSSNGLHSAPVCSAVHEWLVWMSVDSPAPTVSCQVTCSMCSLCIVQVSHIVLVQSTSAAVAQWLNSSPLYRKCESSAQVQSWAGHISPPSWPSAALCSRANGKQPYGCGNVTRAYDYVFKTVHIACYKFAYFTFFWCIMQCALDCSGGTLSLLEHAWSKLVLKAII